MRKECESRVSKLETHLKVSTSLFLVLILIPLVGLQADSAQQRQPGGLPALHRADPQVA